MIVGINKENFGAVLKGIRISLNMTQKDVYCITNLTEETLRRIEKGQNLPSIRTMQDLTVAYKLDIIKIFMTMRKLNDFYSFYDYLDKLIIDYDTNKLKMLRQEFSDYIEDTEVEIFDQLEIEQMEHILK